MPFTFQVSRVNRAKAPLRMPAEGAPARLQGQPVEAMGASTAPFLPSDEHGLLRAVHAAYALHYPLVLSPDAIWLAIAQGFAMHVNANTERLRGKLVRHDGQARLEIRRDDFVKGSAANPWPEVFGAFSDGVARHIGRQRDLVVCDFSTTGPCERAASEIVLLDTLARYFRYGLGSLCGIPEITLEGTAEDWRALRRRARALEEYELGWWTDALGPVLDRLVDTAEGRPDVPFWEAFFKQVDDSGGPWVRGWINVLFPYLREGEAQTPVRNQAMATWKQGLSAGYGGPRPSSIPSGLSRVPFAWHHLAQVFPMLFLGGFVGVAQDGGTLALRPAIGWAVCDDVPAPAPSRADADLEWDDRGTLVAGRASGAAWLTPREIAALAASIERAMAVGGAQLAVVVAGCLTYADRFPEAPLLCHIAVGVPAGSVAFGSQTIIDATELRGTLDAARAVPEAVWRAVDALVPGGLGEHTALLLAVSGSEVYVEARLHGAAAATVATSGATLTVVDLPPEGHAENAGRCVLGMGWCEE
jgi:hypothetical protein